MAHPTTMSRAQRTQLLEKMNSGICTPASFSSRRYSPQVLAQPMQSLDVLYSLIAVGRTCGSWQNVRFSLDRPLPEEQTSWSAKYFGEQQQYMLFSSDWLRQEGQEKTGSKAVPERPQTRTESGHLPDLSGAPCTGRV